MRYLGLKTSIEEDVSGFSVVLGWLRHTCANIEVLHGVQIVDETLQIDPIHQTNATEHLNQQTNSSMMAQRSPCFSQNWNPTSFANRFQNKTLFAKQLLKRLLVHLVDQGVQLLELCHRLMPSGHQVMLQEPCGGLKLFVKSTQSNTCDMIQCIHTEQSISTCIFISLIYSIVWFYLQYLQYCSESLHQIRAHLKFKKKKTERWSENRLEWCWPFPFHRELQCHRARNLLLYCTLNRKVAWYVVLRNVKYTCVVVLHVETQGTPWTTWS